MKYGAHLGYVDSDVSQFQISISTFGVHHGTTVKLHLRPPAFMVSTHFGLWREPLLENSYPPPTTTTDNDALHQLQARIAEMECRHEEELIKLKVDHNELEACVRRP